MPGSTCRLRKLIVKDVPGSTVAMTENAFMTDAAWVELTPKLLAGYHMLEVVWDNPQWWALELFDGFGSHTTNLEAMEVRYFDCCVRLHVRLSNLFVPLYFQNYIYMKIKWLSMLTCILKTKTKRYTVRDHCEPQN